MEAAQPYLQEIDSQLQQLAQIVDAANQEWLAKGQETLTAESAKMMASMDCDTTLVGTPYNVTYEYPNYVCQPYDSSCCADCYCEQYCYEDFSDMQYGWYETTLHCDNALWFFDHLERGSWSSVYACQCEIGRAHV